MLNKIFSYFKSSNSFSETLSKLSLEGNIYKKIIGKEKFQISSECTIYMTIVNESTFDYNLNIHNSDYEFSKDAWETLSFPITNDLGVKVSKENGNDAIVWEREKEFYIFYPFLETNNKENFPTFVKLLSTLISANAYEVEPEKVKPEDSEDYVMNIGDNENIARFIEDNYSKIYEEIIDINAIDKNIDVLSKKLDRVKIQHDFKKNFPKANELFCEEGVLYQYDVEKDDLVEVKKECFFKIFSVEAFCYYLVVDDVDEKTLTCTTLTSDAHININKSENIVMWLSRETGAAPNAYNFVFYKGDAIDSLNKLVARSQYESGAHAKFDELKDDEREWLEQANEVEQEEEDVEMELEMDKFQEQESVNANKTTAQAYLHDRTFVVRENNTIGVYKTDENDVLSHIMNLPAVTEYDSKNVDIKNAQMFYSDSNMIFLDKENPNNVFRYDLQKGKIIEEWSVDGKIDAVAPEHKFDQMENNPLLQGVNKNSLFTMDTRLKNKVVNMKSYKTNPKMNCLATTSVGGIAVGSINGEIRLYNEIGKNAKTLLPCFGDPIKSVDVTSDGKYILATCDRYLILISTTCKGGQLGFDVQMGKEKPKPILLKIKAKDIAKYKLQDLVFAPARFNVSKTDGESNIITSLGDFVINWNFSRVKKGILDDYKIKRVYQNVVDNQFKFNRNQIVLTMDHKLRIQNQTILFNEK